MKKSPLMLVCILLAAMFIAGCVAGNPGNRQLESLSISPATASANGSAGAIHGHGLLERVADHGNAAKRDLGSMYRSGFRSHKQRHGFRDGPGDLRQRSHGNLHGFRVGSGLWLHGAGVQRDFRLRRGLRPGFRNGTDDLPIVRQNG